MVEHREATQSVRFELIFSGLDFVRRMIESDPLSGLESQIRIPNEWLAFPEMSNRLIGAAASSLLMAFERSPIDVLGCALSAFFAVWAHTSREKIYSFSRRQTINP